MTSTTIYSLARGGGATDGDEETGIEVSETIGEVKCAVLNLYLDQLTFLSREYELWRTLYIACCKTPFPDRQVLLNFDDTMQLCQTSLIFGIEFPLPDSIAMEP